MGKIIKIIILILILMGLAYFGACLYANFFAFQSGLPEELEEMPEVQDAPHVIIIQNTGNMFFTANYEKHGSVWILHGYWELVGQEFKYRDRDLILDEAIFGTIISRGRQ